MIIELEAIDFLSAIVVKKHEELHSLDGHLSFTYSALRKSADSLEDKKPSLRVDLGKHSLNNIQTIFKDEIAIDMPTIEITINKRIIQVMKRNCPSDDIVSLIDIP